MEKKFICVILLMIIFVSPVSVLADVNQDVISAQAKYQEYQSRIDDMTGEIIKLNSEVENKIWEIDENNAKIDSLNSEIKSSKNRILELEDDIEELELMKDNRIRSFYKSGGYLSYLEMVVKFNSLADFINKIETTSKILNIDRELIEKIEISRNELSEHVLKIEDNKSSIVKLNDKVKEDKNILELRKEEQQELLNRIQLEQDKFSEEVLEVAERELIKPQRETIESSNDITTLNSAISQLSSIRDGQLISDVVVEEVNSLIDLGNSKVSELKSAIEAQGNVLPSRGVGFESSNGNSIVDYAYEFLGKPYVWGAVGPEAFDCSGLTSYVYRHAAGIEITRTTYTQINVGREVSRDELQPGDLVFTYDNEHVGIYVGNGMYINATYPGSTVRVTPVSNFYAARRIL